MSFLPLYIGKTPVTISRLVEFCYMQKLGAQPSTSPSDNSHGSKELSSKLFLISLISRFYILNFCNSQLQPANLSLRMACSFPCPTPCLHAFLAEIPGIGKYSAKPKFRVRTHLNSKRRTFPKRRESYTRNLILRKAKIVVYEQCTKSQ